MMSATELNYMKNKQLIETIEHINNEHNLHLPINRSNRYKRKNIETLRNYYDSIDEQQAIDDIMNIGEQPIIQHMQIPHIPKTNKTPTRYVDSDEYKQRIQHDDDNKFFKSFDKNKYKIKDIDDIVSKDERINKFRRTMHPRKSYLDDLMQHSNNIREFWRHEQIHRADDYTDAVNSFLPTTSTIERYNDWLTYKTEQESIVDNIMEMLERTPTHWHIDFESLNNDGRKLLFPRLLSFFHEHIDNMSVKENYNIKFRVNGMWYTKSLNKIYNKLMTNFDEQHFIFNIDTTPPEYFYQKGVDDVPEWSLFSELIFVKSKDVKSNNDRGGHFFQYLINDKCPARVVEYLQRLQIFNSLVDDKNKQRRELNDCCFVYALQQTGCYDDNILNQIRLRINNRYLSQSAINSLCEEFKIHLKLSYIDDNATGKNKRRTIQSCNNKRNYLGVPESDANTSHTINIYEQHYFIEERTPFSTYYIQHIEELDDDKYNQRLKNSKTNEWIVAESNSNNDRYISSSNLVRTLMNKNYFQPITYGQYKVLNTTFHHDIECDISNINLEYNPKSCTQLIAPPKNKINNNADKTYWYCDFECDVSQRVHVPYMCVLHSANGKINKEFRGTDCNKQLLDYLPDNAVVYYHNLAYDFRMIAQYGIYKSIIKGTKTMKGDIKYNSKKLHFKDSLAVLSCKLAQLPKMFNIDGVHKELFPYNYYTVERLNSGAVGVISDAGKYESRTWTDDDYKTFNENIDKITNCRLSDNTFDMWSYVSFYCNQDVRILRLGFNSFRDGFMKDFNIDPFEFISISSLANEVFNKLVYYPNKNLYKLGGHVRYFCSKAIYGGRCMTAYNKKWHTNCNICDFDAVSLYPSAMSRLYTVEGIPKVITNDKLNYEFIKTQSAYIVEIEITKINKHYPFPLVVHKVNGLNINDDNLVDGETLHMVVDNIMLEDLIEFQKIEFNIIKGYYWDGKRDYTIQKVIRNIFNKRVEYKQQHNSLEQLYKLIMNSCYGKTIERPVDKDYKYIHAGDELDKYWLKNYNKIIEDIEIDGSDIHAIKTIRPIDKHFNFSLLGIQVLSMSKRIMNEVMCLAFDIGCHIYYQDTDSMHIELNDLTMLETAFRNKYNRELIGKNMGQFHSDFPTINGHDDMPVAIESYFIMKKMYVDKLQDSTGDIDYMIRGKGLTLNSILYAANERFGGDMMNLYQSMYNGNTEEFDLTKGQPMFAMNKNMTVSTINNFIRRIKTNYDVGERDKYFNYAYNDVNDMTLAHLEASIDIPEGIALCDSPSDIALCDSISYIALRYTDIIHNNIDKNNNNIQVNTLLCDDDLHSQWSDTLTLDDMKMHHRYMNIDENSPLYQRFYQNFNITFNNQKHGSILGNDVFDNFQYKQTGMTLLVNQVYKFGVIDIDIDKQLCEHEREHIRNAILNKLSYDDLIIVQSGSGGIHIYCNNDIENLVKNANIKCCSALGYDIDYIVNSGNSNKQACIMLPGSYNDRGQYKFIRGDYKSSVKHTTTQILKLLGITLNLDTIFDIHYEDDSYTALDKNNCELHDDSNIDYLDEHIEKLIVDGLDLNVDIHNYTASGTTIDKELTLLPLFSAINCLSPINRELAYNKLRMNQHLTINAAMNFDKMKDDCYDKHSHINVLRKIIKLYNSEYYDKYLSNINSTDNQIGDNL